MKSFFKLVAVMLVFATVAVSLVSCNSSKTSGGYTYVVTDETNKTCMITGISGTDDISADIKTEDTGTTAETSSADTSAPAVSAKKTFTIPEKIEGYTVTAVAVSAFAGKFTGTDIKWEIVIPSNVKKLDALAFADNNAIVSVKFADDSEIGEIPTGFLRNCSAVSELALPASVKSIGYQAFLNCTGLKTVTTEDKLELIDYYAFSGCSALETLTIKVQEVKIRGNAFKGCAMLSNLSTPDIEKDETVYLYSEDDKTLMSEDGKTLVRIFDTGRTEYTIAKSVTTLENGVFGMMESLENIKVEDGNENFDSEKGVLYTKNSLGLIAYPAAKSGETYEIPSSVTSISPYAFYGNKNLKSLTVKVSEDTAAVAIFKSGDDGVVYTNDNKTLVVYPAGKADTAFTVPASVSDISEGAFCGNQIITEIVLPETVKAVGASAFKNCKSLEKLTVMNKTITFGADVTVNSHTNLTIVFYGTEAEWDSVKSNVTYRVLDKRG